MTTITFDTSESLAQELQYLARAKHKSLSETLNDIVRAYFEKNTKASKLDEMKSCQHDPLFLSDLQEINDDFEAIDLEAWWCASVGVFTWST